jgi:hypothetical protein
MNNNEISNIRNKCCELASKYRTLNESLIDLDFKKALEYCNLIYTELFDDYRGAKGQLKINLSKNLSHLVKKSILIKNLLESQNAD